MKIRHKLLLKSGIAILFIFLIICGLISCSNHKKDELRVGYIPISECAQLYVAIEMGYFEKEGLDVKLISLPGGDIILNGVNSGFIDVGFSNVVSLVLRRADNSNFFSIFGGTYETKENQNHAIFVNTSRWNANPIEDLKGATIALNTFENVEEMMVTKYLRSIGLDWGEDSIKKIKIDFSQMLPLLETGTIDAVSIVEPYITIAKKDSTHKMKWLCNHFLTTTPKTLVATYVSSETIASQKHEEIVKFTNAMLKATDYMKNHDSKIRKIIATYVKISPEILSNINLSEFSEKIDTQYLGLILEDMKTLGYLNGNKSILTSELIWHP